MGQLQRSEYAASHGAAFHLGAGAVLSLRNQTAGRLTQSIAFANQMAAGDLSARFNGASSGEFGELSRALNQLNVNLQAVVSRRHQRAVDEAVADQPGHRVT